MANKNKLIRLKALDNSFRNKYRRYTLDDLVEVCSEALYEYEGVLKGISRRSVQEDIKDMRSGKFGYEAPIVCEEGYYYYSDRNFSITNTPLTEEDYQTIRNSLAVLEQFSELGQLEALRHVEEKLQTVLSAKKDESRSYIQFEKTEYPAAEKWLGVLLAHTKAQQGLTVAYQPYTYDAPANFDTYPLLLKEFNGRWFLIGYNNIYNSVQNFALDRIVDVKLNYNTQAPEHVEALLEHFNQLIGVTFPETGIEKILFQVSSSRRKYLETKPWHSTQQLIDAQKGIFQLEVGINPELKAKLLSFGSDLIVLEPIHLKESIKKVYEDGLENYSLYISA